MSSFGVVFFFLAGWLCWLLWEAEGEERWKVYL